MATKVEVEQFLRDFQAGLRLHPPALQIRVAQQLVELNVTTNQAIAILNRLTAENYSAGPSPDDEDPNREVWIFGIELDGTEVYIKVALKPDTRKKTVKYALIWSFHKAERPLKYPLR
jgi:hypothetical protein